MTNDYLEATRAQRAAECSYHKAKLAGDEIFELCELEGTQCLLAHGYDCETAEKEWLESEHYEKPKQPSYRIIADKLNGGE